MFFLMSVLISCLAQAGLDDVTANDNDEIPVSIPNIYETISIITAENLPDCFQLPDVTSYQELERHASFPKIKSQFLHDIQELKNLAPYFVGDASNKKIDVFYERIQQPDFYFKPHLLTLYKEMPFHLRTLLTTLKRYQNEYQKNDIDSKQKNYIATVLSGCLEGIDQCTTGICARFRSHFIDLQASEYGLSGKIVAARKELLQNCISSFLTTMQRTLQTTTPGSMDIHYFNSYYNLVCNTLKLTPIEDPFAQSESESSSGPKHGQLFKSLVHFSVSKCAILQHLSKGWSDEMSTILQQEGVSTWETKDISLPELAKSMDILETLDNKLFKPISVWLGKEEKNALNIWSLMDQKNDDTYSLARYQEKLFAWITSNLRESKDEPLNEPKTTVFASTPNTTNINLHIGTIDSVFFWIFNDTQSLKAGDPCTFESDNHITLELSHLTQEHLYSNPETLYTLVTQALKHTSKAEDIASFFMNPDISKQLYQPMSPLTQEISSQITDKLAHQKGDKFQTTLCKCVCDQVISSKATVVAPEAISWLIDTPLLKLVLLELQQHKIDITPITENLSSLQISDFSATDIKHLLSPESCHTLCMDAYILGQAKLLSKILLTGYCDEIIEYLDTYEQEKSLLFFARHGILYGLKALLANDATNVNCADHLGNTLLNCATKASHLECVKLLLSVPGIQVNASSYECRETALHIASETGQLGCVKLLLAVNGIQLDLTNSDRHTALDNAAKNGHAECMALLLAAGAKTNMLDKNGNTPLRISLKHNHIKCAEILLASGADVNIRDSQGDTPLNHAAKTGNVEYVKLLLGTKGILLETQDLTDLRALSNASKNGHVECVKALLAAGADVNTLGCHCYPLSLAALAGHVECVEVLLAAGADVNTLGCHCYPLSLAALAGHVECVKLLLNSKGIKIDAKDCEHHNTALGNAAKNGQAECMAELLTAGAKTSTQDNNGYTPLHHAAKAGHAECIKLLLGAHGIQLNAKDNRGNTALANAAKAGHTECIKLLVGTHGIQLNAKDNRGNTALANAAKAGHTECIKLLVGTHGIQLNAKDNRGNTALASVAKHGFALCLAALLHAGAEYETQNELGRSPLQMTTTHGHISCAKMLLFEGADVNTQDNNGNTSLNLAASAGHVKLIKVLLIDSNIQLNVPDSYGLTALSNAAKNGHAECIAKLLAAKADITKKTKEGYTALSLAAMHGNEVCVYKLLDSANLDCRKALMLAKKYNHKSCIILLEKHASRTNSSQLKPDGPQTFYEKIIKSCTIS
ncbi:MAG: ankyrin repeat domain-containing protein [Candidatus Endonucleobacter sp. (ex Gigantidas childressi)]|nr:ankyrin repeat domain-containing protein [Candidatus Endonucleobacter sp. (ex Gigantidas childressi)]